MIYHYTKSIFLQSILNEGLRPIAVGFDEKKEKPLLWFTTNEEWEPTVFCNKAPSLQEAHSLAMSLGWFLVRVAIDNYHASYVGVQGWNLAGTPPDSKRLLVRVAKLLGSKISEWRSTFSVISPIAFVAVDYYDGSKWQRLEDIEAAA